MSAGVASEPAPDWHGLSPLAQDVEFRHDPHPALHALRAASPVNETPLGFWRLTRHRDCVRLLREVKTGVRPLDGSVPMGGEDRAGDFMLLQDPPNHTRLRKLVSKAFTPRAIGRWQPRVAEWTEQLLDRALAAPGGGSTTFDAIAGLALPVPAQIICEMLGVPVEDRDRFTQWTADATHGLAGELAPPEVQRRASDAGNALGAYFERLIDQRRGHESEGLLDVLIHAEEAGDRLTPVELLSQSVGLLIAGFETTIGLIGNGLLALARNPDQQRKLREQPGLIDNAIEECLRYDGPVSLTVRYLHEPAGFGGRTIPRGAQVWAMLWGANRDPERFADPDRLDLARANAKDHLAFGGGAHLCLGTHLARLEAREAIGRLVARTQHFELACDEVEWGTSLFRVPAALALHARVKGA